MSLKSQSEKRRHVGVESCLSLNCGGSVLFNIAQTHLANERTPDSIVTPHQSVQAPYTHWDPFERPYVGPKGVGRKELTHAQ
jgi:hypothetical protein